MPTSSRARAVTEPASVSDAALLARHHTGRGGNLKDVLDRLRQTLDNLGGAGIGAASGALGGLGSAGMGAAGRMAGGAQAGMAATQNLANQIRRTMAQTQAAFAATMSQVQKTWKRSTTGFASDFYAALTNQAKRGRGRGARWGKATRRAWKTASAWTRATTRAARQGTARGTARRSRQAGATWRNIARRTRRLGRNLGRTWRRGSKAFGRSSRAASRIARRWGRGARRSWQNLHRQLGRRARRWGRGVRQWGRRAGKRFRRPFRNAWARANRRFQRTGSIRAAAGAGIAGFVGRAGMAGLGELGIAFGTVINTIKLLQSQVERQNAGNRHLSGYSGAIGAAFGQLDLGDQMRELRLARATEGSAVTLANLTNKVREGQGGIDRLQTGLSNRFAAGKAALVEPIFRNWGGVADTANEKLNQVDPQGNLLANAAGWAYQKAAQVGGFYGALLGGASLKDAGKIARDLADEERRQQQMAVAPQLDAWANHIVAAQNLGPIRPARQVQP